MASTLPGFYSPSDFGSMSNWGTPMGTDIAGQTDYAASMMPSLAGVTVPGSEGSWMDSFSSWLNDSGALGKKLADGTQLQGWAAPAIGAASGLMNGFMGMQQYGLAKEQAEQRKREFQLNYDAQKKTTNSALADRQAARVASNPGAYQSVGDYLKTYGI